MAMVNGDPVVIFIAGNDAVLSRWSSLLSFQTRWMEGCAGGAAMFRLFCCHRVVLVVFVDVVCRFHLISFFVSSFISFWSRCCFFRFGRATCDAHDHDGGSFFLSR